jgi:hypothetical protein
VLLAIAVLVGVGGFVHLRIWEHEYRHAPVRELFVANWAASAVVVILLVGTVVVRRGAWAGSVGALLVSVGSLAALALSRGPGVPTLHGTFKEHGLETTSSYFFHVGSAKTVLVAEGLAAVLAAWTLLRPARARAR